jgi:hypothetical protein
VGDLDTVHLEAIKGRMREEANAANDAVQRARVAAAEESPGATERLASPVTLEGVTDITGQRTLGGAPAQPQVNTVRSASYGGAPSGYSDAGISGKVPPTSAAEMAERWPKQLAGMAGMMGAGLLRGVREQAAGATFSSGAGFAETVAKLLPQDYLDAADELLKQGYEKSEIAFRTNQPSPTTPLLGRTVFGAATSVPLSVAALATRNAKAGATMLGLATGAQKYGELRSEDMPRVKALLFSAMRGAAEGLTEAPALEAWMTMGRGNAVKGATAWAKSFLESMRIETTTEELATVTEYALDAAARNKPMRLSELIPEMGHVLLQTPLVSVAMGGFTGTLQLAEKSDTGPDTFQGYIEQHFPGMQVETTEYGAKVTSPSGKAFEIHRSDSPIAPELREAALRGVKEEKRKAIESGKETYSGVYLHSGMLTATENDVIWLTGQQTDDTTLHHEKAHLIMLGFQSVLSPEEMAQFGITPETAADDPIWEAVAEEFEQYAHKRTPSLSNPMSPLDKAYQRVVDFFDEVGSSFGGTSRRQLFEKMRKGEILRREGVNRLPGETDAMYQNRTVRPEWHEPDTKTASGRIVGAPESHASPQAREGLIRRMVNVVRKMNEVNPEQSRWYELAGEDIRQIFDLKQNDDGSWSGNVDKADQFLRAVAQWSIQADVSRNTTDAVEVIRRIAQNRRAEVAGVVTSAEKMADRFDVTISVPEVTADLSGFGPKAVSFYWDLYNATFNLRDDANTTIDRHIIAAWDLINSAGQPMGGLKTKQYRWANNVMRDITARVNKEAGLDLDPRNVQAMIWAWQRGGRVFAKQDVDHIGANIGKGVVTGEVIPATDSAVGGWVHDKRFEVKQWASEQILRKVLYDKDGNDIILKKLGALHTQAPADRGMTGMGTYRGATNPNAIVPMHLKDMSPETINLYADLFGYIFTQNAVPWYRPSAGLTNKETATAGVAVRRKEGALDPSLVKSFYEILTSRIPDGELTYTGNEIHVLNFMELDREEFFKTLKEVVNEWQRKTGIEDAAHGRFGAESDYRTSDPDTATEWAGGSYRSRLAAAGRSDLLDWADSRRAEAVSAWEDLGRVTPPLPGGAHLQARKADSIHTFPIKDFRGKDITPAVAVIAKSQGKKISTIMPQDRIWLLPDATAVFLESFERHDTRSNKIIAEAATKNGAPEFKRDYVFGAAIQAIRFHGIQQTGYGADWGYAPGLAFEVFRTPTPEQYALLKKSLGLRKKMVVDITDPKTGNVIGWAEGAGQEGFQALVKAIEDAYAPKKKGAKLQSRTITTPAGVYPEERDGWRYEGFWAEMGRAQYTNRDPKSKAFEFTVYAKPEDLDERIAKKLAQIEGAKFQARLVSRAAEVAEKNLPSTIPEKDLIPLLKKFGVKDAEIKDLGIYWLLHPAGDEGPSRGKITKAELLDHIATHQIEIKEVMKGVPQAAEWVSFGKSLVLNTPARSGSIKFGISIEPLPNGMFLLRTPGGLTEAHRTLEEAKRDGERVAANLQRPETKFSAYTLPGGENYRELLLTVPEGAEKREADVLEAEMKRRASAGDTDGFAEISQKFLDAAHRIPANFHSPHWDEPNILAHIRFNDRTGPNGERLLHVEEFQSDWDREARQGDRMSWSPEDGYQPDVTPPMPFSGDWKELVAKRMLLYAAEKGYDGITWVTGEQTAERYDLSKKLAKIDWQRNDDGRYDLAAYPKGSDTAVIGEVNLSAEDLPKYVGKELAARIVESKKHGEILRGLDLKVGGEWAHHLYDKKFPSIFEKLAKKYGVKAGEIKIKNYDGATGHQIMDEMGIPQSDQNQYWRELSQPERDELFEKWFAAHRHLAVHHLPITPPMRSELLGFGLPMYQTRKAASGRVPGYPNGKGLTMNFTPEEANRVLTAYIIGRWDDWEYSRSHEETKAAAEELLDTQDKRIEFTTKLLNRDPQTSFRNRAEGHAASMIAAGVAMDLLDTIKGYRQGTISYGEVLNFLSLANSIMQKTYHGFSEAAGITESRKIPVETSRGEVGKEYIDMMRDAYADAMSSLRALTTGPNGEFDEAGLREILDAIEVLPEPGELIRILHKATTKELFFEYWYFALLSGPKTHIVNLVDTAVQGIWGVPERAMAALIRKMRGGEGVAPAEPLAMTYGMVRGFGDALLAAKVALDTGTSAFHTKGKFETAPAWSSARMRINPKKPWGKAVDALGSVFRSVGRVLFTVDEFNMMMNYNAELYAAAYRKAYYEGRGGLDFQKRLDELLDPSNDEIRATIEKGAEAFAREQTYNDLENMTAFGKGVMAARNSFVPVRIVLPFVSIADRIGSQTISRIGPAGLMLDKVRAEIKEGGAASDLAIAKMSLGGMVMATFCLLAAHGVIIGSGPKNPRERERLMETGWKPRSIRLGDTYYEYGRFGVFGTLLQMSADAVKYWDQIPAGRIDSFVASMVLAFSDSMTDKYFLRGIGEVIQTIRDTTSGRADRYFRRLSTTLIPNVLKQVEQVVDPRILDRESWLQEWQAAFPWLSDEVPAKINLWGEDVVKEQWGYWLDLILPVGKGSKYESLVRDEIANNQMAINMPPRAIEGRRPPQGLVPMRDPSAAEGVELTQEEYRDFVRLAAGLPVEIGGREFRVDHMTLEERLGRLMESSAYQEATMGPGGMRERLTIDIIYTYREAARKIMLGESEGLNDRRIEKKIQRKNLLVPERMRVAR